MADQVVLVTGVAGYWGRRVAARLAAGEGYRVLGLDREPPAAQIPGLDFVRADVRNPLLAELFQAEGVNTVCHLAFVETVRPGDGAFDLNVTGTVKVLEACAGAGVRKVVLKSSTAVYGARPGNTAFLTEEHALRGSKRYGYTRDLVEIETFCQGFRREAPDLALTILRFASIVGPAADTPLTRLLDDPQAPTLLGFDPLMQIVHEDDVVGALAHAVGAGATGVFNVAAFDAHPLSKVRGLAGKRLLPVFHRLAYRALDRARAPGSRRLQRHLPIEPDYLRYRWVADLRRMEEELGFVPDYTAEDALREFAEGARGDPRRAGPLSMARDEARLRDEIERRRQARQQQGGDND